MRGKKIEAGTQCVGHQRIERTQLSIPGTPTVTQLQRPHQTDLPRGSLRVANIRLCRANGAAADRRCDVEHRCKRTRLCGIAQACAGAMCFHATHIASCHTSPPKGTRQQRSNSGISMARVSE